MSYVFQNTFWAIILAMTVIFQQFNLELSDTRRNSSKNSNWICIELMDVLRNSASNQRTMTGGRVLSLCSSKRQSNSRIFLFQRNLGSILFIQTGTPDLLWHSKVWKRNTYLQTTITITVLMLWTRDKEVYLAGLLLAKSFFSFPHETGSFIKIIVTAVGS